jgi:low temperature requirement protein LtrA
MAGRAWSHSHLSDATLGGARGTIAGTMPRLPARSETRRRWLEPPRLRTLEDRTERRASWLELFFDLVFVVAIAELSHELVVDHSLIGFARFAGLFLPVFIAWQGFTIYADRFDTDDLLFRGVMLLGMLAIGALAVQVPDVAHGRSTGFVLAYAALRSLMVSLYLRSYLHVPEARALIVRYVGGYSIGIAVWVASLAVDEPARYVVWGVALAFEYALPIIVRRLHEMVPVDASHIPERFALFTIIVLGESVVAVALGAAGSDWRVASAAAATLGFLAVAGLWWVYFDVGAGLRLRRATGAILVFAYVHIPLLMALTVVAAGVSILIEQAGAAHLDLGGRVALAGGSALFLACVTVTQLATVRGLGSGVLVGRAVAALASVALVALGGVLDPVTFVGALDLLLAALVVAEIVLHQAADETETVTADR